LQQAEVEETEESSMGMWIPSRWGWGGDGGNLMGMGWGRG